MWLTERDGFSQPFILPLAEFHCKSTKKMLVFKTPFASLARVLIELGFGTGFASSWKEIRQILGFVSKSKNKNATDIKTSQ